MDPRAPPPTSRPRLPQRAVSGGPYAPAVSIPKRPTLPSRLSAVRSTSQPVGFVDLTSEDANGPKSDTAGLVGGTELVRSPDGIKVEDDEVEPPAKRAKTTGEDFHAASVAGDEEELGEADKIIPGSPLPTLPSSKLLTKKLVAQRRHRFGIQPAARKAHGLDPPAVATRVPPPKKAADFSPWIGSHPEDVLNENVVKTGFFDKPQGVNQAECSSAKPTISSSLSQRNSHGLSLLSYLFSTVLEKRQAIGKCIAPSTFKPPPRVTVTDTKREAWLRDLANPNIPLRKQSRTIPHGIRGKVLMEQCLAKDIPLQRAVWLAKCVGANELRAFRRKGVSGSAAASGESKWVREWTMHVEQFVEDVIATCGQENWRPKMNYAIKLGAAFYSDKLLDTDHYLDWLVSSLADAALELLPIWLVFAQLYWKELTMYGRRGRKLAEAILEHLDRLTKLKAEAGDSLRTRLQQLITVLGVTNRGCLIIPRTWNRYKHLLTLESLPPNAHESFRNVIKRNDRLTHLLSKTARNTFSPTLELFTRLDAVDLGVDVESLSSESLKFIPDIVRLTSALLDWASTPYRVGNARVYLSASIIANLHKGGHDTSGAILRYLEAPRELAMATVEQIHRVIIEVSHQQAFSTGRYLQWLITSGVLAIGAKSSYATSLIAVLPATGLPMHVVNTRKTLMRRLGYSLDHDVVTEEIFSRTAEISSASHAEHNDPIQMLGDLNLPAKLNLSTKICAHLQVKAKERNISVEGFCQARRILESFQDVRSLADLVRTSITTDRSALLATVCDTMNVHAKSFAAIQELLPLADAVAEHYVTLRSQQPLNRTLILALSGLAQRLADKTALVELLNNDLLICEQQSSLAVCSPASDSLIGMHATTLDSDDDLDAVFASGNTMDDQLMHRVFARIMQRASKPAPSGLEGTTRIPSWLNQLRAVDSGETFERLVLDHLRSLVTTDVNKGFWTNGAVYLVASSCASLSTMANLANEVKSAGIASIMLTLFISPDVADLELHETETYRYRLQQELCMDAQAENLLTLLRMAGQSPEFTPTDPAIVNFVIRDLTAHHRSTGTISADAKSSESLRSNVGRTATAILARGGKIEPEPEESYFRTIVRMATPLSVQFSVGVLRYLRSAPTLSKRDEAVFGDALLEAFNNNMDVWPQLLEFAGENVNSKIRDWAQGQILLMAADAEVTDFASASEQVSRCLQLLAVSSKLAPGGDDTGTVVTLADRLKELEGAFVDPDQKRNELSMQKASPLHQLRILLDLAVMHVQGTISDDDASQQANIALLTVLCSLMVLPPIQPHPSISEQLFDLACTLADNLSETAVTTAGQHLALKALSDARVKFILGKDQDATDAWLVLASPVQPIGSQQQRILNRQPSQMLPSGGRPATSAHQRVPSQGTPGMHRQDTRLPVEMKTTPFAVRQWEIIPDSAPVMGENDASLNLRLFAARKV